MQVKKRQWFPVVFIVLACFSRTSIFGQPGSLQFTNYTSVNGLSSDNVSDITQDKQGYIWIATSEGLNRFDGYGFRKFYHSNDDVHSLVYSVINYLHLDCEGMLWVGTDKGLDKLDPQSLAITHIPSIPHCAITSFLEQGDHLWIGTYLGLYELNKKSGQAILHPLLVNDEYVLGIQADKEGFLWMVSQQNGVIRYDPARHCCKKYSFPPVLLYGAVNPPQFLQLCFDGKESLYIGTWYVGLYKLNIHTGAYTIFKHDPLNARSIGGNACREIFKDEDGSIWISGMEHGFYIYHAATNSFSNHFCQNEIGGGLAGAGVGCIYKDRAGNYWMGTDGGISLYDPHLRKFNTMPVVPDSPKYRLHGILAVFKDREGLLWMSSYSGLYLWDPATGIAHYKGNELGLKYDQRACPYYQDDDGSIWISAIDEIIRAKAYKRDGVTHLAGESFVFSPGGNNGATTMIRDERNHFWLPMWANGGMYRYDTEKRRFCFFIHDSTNAGSLPLDHISCGIVLSRDKLLFGTVFSGLYLFDYSTGQFRRLILHLGGSHSSDSSNIYSLFRDSRSNIWIGTQGDGLIRMDTGFNRVKVFGEKDGLISKTINNRICEDEGGNIWTSTLAGLMKLDMKSGKFIFFNNSDGLQHSQGLDRLYTPDKKTFYIGGDSCIHIFRAAALGSNKVVPALYITGYRIFDREYIPVAGQPMDLKHNQNYLSFEYVALSFTHSEQNKYAVQLAGLDTGWQYTDTRRFASYANLPPGAYTFKVKACNNDGLWNETPASICFTIHPPFWMRWWFRLLVAIIVGSLLYGAYRLRVRRLFAQQNMRDKIARDLHDEVGSTLSGINLFSKIALQSLEGKEHRSRELIEKIAGRSANMVDAMNDIVWSVNPANDSMENILIRMREYATEMLEEQGIAIRFDVHPSVLKLKIGLKERKDFYLIYKEAINNISKYAACSIVFVGLQVKKTGLHLTITDNGKGFDTASERSGNGIKNMVARAKNIGAVLSVVSEPDRGCNIVLCLPIP